MNTREQTLQINNNLEILFTSDVSNGKILDTKVELNGVCLCWIAGEDVESFGDELKTLIKKFRI
jgi:hypothetical protein